MEMREKNITGVLVIAGGSASNLSVISNLNKVIAIFERLGYTNIYLVSPYGKNTDLKLSVENTFLANKYFSKNCFIKYIYFLFYQLSMLYHVLKLNRKYSEVYYIFGQDLSIIPIAISKCLGKRVIIRSDGRPQLDPQLNTSKFRGYALSFVERVNYQFADALLTECEYMLHTNKFDEYNKNVYVGNLFIGPDFFKSNDFNRRKYDIAYIGRFHHEKGIINFVKAISRIIEMDPAIAVLIRGDGELRHEIEATIDEHGLSQNVCLGGWVPHEQLSSYLNSVKVLVLPSYKEGLPNIILEAMACGTAVLATPVGGVPGIVHDGKTGFIMESNSPECIAENVIRALGSPDLERIAEAGRRFVEENFTFERTVENWKEILQSIE